MKATLSTTSAVHSKASAYTIVHLNIKSLLLNTHTAWCIYTCSRCCWIHIHPVSATRGNDRGACLQPSCASTGLCTSRAARPVRRPART